MKRANRIKRNIIVVSLQLFCIILLLEVLTRLFMPLPVSDFVNKSDDREGVFEWNHEWWFKECMTSDDELVYAPIIGKCGVDSSGFHQIPPPRSNASHENAKTLLVIGDSITASSQFSYPLAEKLNKRYDVHLLSVGIPGYNLYQITRYLERHVPRFNRSLTWILVQFCLNDFENTPMIVPHNGSYQIVPLKWNILAETNMAFFINSSLYRHLYSLYKQFGNPWSFIKARVKNDLKSLQMLAKERQCRLIFIIFPNIRDQSIRPFEQGYSDYELRVYRLILNALAESDIAVIDLHSRLETIDNLEDLYSDFQHPNPKGGRMIAKMLENSKYFLP